MATKETQARREEQLSLAHIRALCRLAQRFDLSELELDSGGSRLRIRRERDGATVMAPPAEVVLRENLSPSAPSPSSGENEQPADGSVVISSPFVGTFYRAPGPESPPFVEEGQIAQKGQVLCIVEAMKLMNEIEAETGGQIAEIFVQNATPVEFGEPLFRIETE